MHCSHSSTPIHTHRCLTPPPQVPHTKGCTRRGHRGGCRRGAAPLAFLLTTKSNTHTHTHTHTIPYTFHMQGPERRQTGGGAQPFLILLIVELPLLIWLHSPHPLRQCGWIMRIYNRSLERHPCPQVAYSSHPLPACTQFQLQVLRLSSAPLCFNPCTDEQFPWVPTYKTELPHSTITFTTN